MRGQTTLDFAVGVSLFLVVVVGVFAFVPQALAPFESSAREETATVDRLATQLAGGMLGSAGDPYHLDRACTVAFFESGSGGDPAGDDDENTDGDGVLADPFGGGTYSERCNFDDVGVNERLGLPDGTTVRLGLFADTDGDGTERLLCYSVSDDEVVETGSPDCDPTAGDDDVVLGIGRGATPTGSVVSARRVVRIEGGLADGSGNANLRVEVW